MQKVVFGEILTSIPKFGPEIKNRCTQKVVFGEILASIRKSGLEIKNRCTKEGLNRQNPASIRKSGPEIKVSVSAITCPRFKKAGCVPCYSLVHLSGRRFRYASGFDPGGMAAVLLSTSDR